MNTDPSSDHETEGIVAIKMAVVRENARFFIAEIESSLPSLSPDDAAAGLEKLSEYHRIAAIAGFLTTLDRAVFREDLKQSAQSRLRQLQLLPAEAAGYFQRASRIEPFCDALAAREDELAERIAALSPAQVLEGEEFEENHCYARVLLALLALEPSPRADEAQNLDRALSALETALDGNLPRRLAACQALAQRDADAFHTALLDLIEERDLHIQKRKRTLVPDMEREATEAAIYIEGMALLRLAARIGINSDESYRFIPDLVRPDR